MPAEKSGSFPKRILSRVVGGVDKTLNPSRPKNFLIPARVPFLPYDLQVTRLPLRDQTPFLSGGAPRVQGRPGVSRPLPGMHPPYPFFSVAVLSFPMVEQLSLSFGWLLIIGGTVFLLIEAASPGFFIAVPGTVLIILGILFVLGVDVFSSPAGVIIGVGVALAASLVTIWIYRRINPGEESPTTISRDSLLGKEGIVVKTVDQDSLSGKVQVAGQEWSARTEKGTIPPGTHVRVVRSEGVHTVVEEVRP